ncbi:MAG: S8 family serine peptidase [Agathobacter sp.]|nr:S8 family serine peptidase [Agathobacter sp.]
MRKRCKLVALLVVICMVATLLPIVPAEEYEASEKVSAELLELLDVTYEDLTAGNYIDSGETYSCIIWIQDVDVEEAVEAGIDAAEMTRDDYSVWSRYDYPYTTYEANGLTYVDVEFDENETDEYVQTYIETEREAAAELYSASNNSFVAENFMARDMSVTYVSKYSPCVFVNLTISKVAEMVSKNNVVEIDCQSEVIDQMDALSISISESEIQEAIEVVRADQATEIYDVTGAGVKIGQIELSCPNVSTVIKNPNSNGNLIKGEIDLHSNTVYKIMNMVAPEATYYATGRYPNDTATSQGSFYEQVEWLLSQGVNIINMSAGAGGAGNVNVYSSRTRWVDHIAYNHDVHFVVSAGNEMDEEDLLQGVTDPGMAYNAITVGNVYRTESDNYIIHPSSSYNHNGSVITAFKPDISAPGVYTSRFGTSFSAPLVTGTIALMCEYRPALKTKQHIVKAILAATTSKTIRRYETIDAEFEIYGSGMLDARSALYALYVGDYVNYTGELKTLGQSRTYKMNVSSSDTNMRVALAYANRVEYSQDGNHLNVNLLNGYIGKLDLEVYDPNGNLVAACYSENLSRNANLKIVEFMPNGVYGDYTIKITVVQRAVYSSNDTINFGVAWR